MKEFSLIAKYFKPLTHNFSGALGLLDDTAQITCNQEKELVITLDTICEGVHFLENSTPEIIANRLLIPNLSDLASAGAVPKYYLMTGNITEKQNEIWYKKFCNQLQKIQKEYNFCLIGGDTVKTSGQKIFLSATFIGETEKNKTLKRNGAKIGDDVYVSEKIGGAWLGLNILQKKLDFKNLTNKFIKNYNQPEARIELGLAIKNIANSCTDISDGLIKDLENICNASNIASEIYLDNIPLALPKKYILEQISGGDDYELIFTSNKKNAEKIKQISKKLKTKITKIGRIIKANDKQKKVTILGKNLEEINYIKSGYEH
jgi:thiamine-monophosphate kinase